MKLRILIVDDEPAITESITKYFALLEYDITSANDPEEALRMVFEDNYMIVISDIMMPGLNGIELLKKIKEFNGMIQVIMITGVVTIENVLACLRGGASECLLKPLDLEHLKSSVEDATAKLRRWEKLIESMVKRKD